MKKILFLCPYPENCAAGQRLKFEPHFQYFAENSFGISVNSFMTQRLWEIAYKDGHFLEKIFLTLFCLVRRFVSLFFLRQYDAVYIFMDVVPFGPTIFERLACFMSKKIIYDIEDNVLEQEAKNKRFVKRFFSSNQRYKLLIQQAEHTIASTPALAGRCKEISQNKDVSCILPTLDRARFHPRVLNMPSDQTVTIGWTGTFSSKKYLELIIPHLENLSKDIDFKLLIIGNFEFTHPFLNFEVLQWSASEEISQLHQIDIGLYPLPNDPWITGKSGLKTLQYMAIGIPSISSKFGNIKNIVTDGVEGFLVENNEEWVGRLRYLILDQEYRLRMGAKAREKFQKKFSQDSNQEKYLKILQKVTSFK
ncbi:glycosyltransferase [Gammaproteobacteria bacterium]|nr:glycosyltransferase [Gammaproteobacteria bacterium]